MRAWQFSEFGVSNLKLESVPEPKPGPGEVRVELTAQSLNYRDLMMIEGRYNPKQSLPLIPGSDGAGVVAEVGSSELESLLGRRVMTVFSPFWIDGTPQRSVVRHTLGGPLPGTLAESIVLPASGVLEVPEHLTDVEAATFTCAGVTAWNAVCGLGAVEPGQKVLVEGSGGVSVFALQFAKLAGAEVFATSSSDAKLERLRELGADATANYRITPDWGRAAQEWAGEGVDLVVDVGGAKTLPQALAAIRMGGTIAIIGVLSGAESLFSVVPVLMGQLRLQGIIVGSRQLAVDMLTEVAAQEMRPVVDSTFAFEELPAAIEHMAAGKHFGKVTLARDSTSTMVE